MIAQFIFGLSTRIGVKVHLPWTAHSTKITAAKLITLLLILRRNVSDWFYLKMKNAILVIYNNNAIRGTNKSHLDILFRHLTLFAAYFVGVLIGNDSAPRNVT